MNKLDILSLILIFVAEILLFFGFRNESLIIHSFNILLIIGIIISKENSDFVEVISLISLFRIINLTLPILFSFTIYWFVTIYGIMFIPIAMIIRNQRMSFKNIGITKNYIYLLPVAVVIGIGLGVIEYYILSPVALIPEISLSEILKLSIVMFLFVGLVEEIIFRVFVQTKLEDEIGITKGLLLTSILFGFMHSGYLNIYEILFASFAGLVIGLCYQRTRSLILIVVIHGINNIVLFGVIPFISKLQIFS